MNQSTWAFGTHWGTYASTAQLPNVAGATRQNVNVSLGDLAWVTGDGLYVCTDATFGAGVWARIGG